MTLMTTATMRMVGAALWAACCGAWMSPVAAQQVSASLSPQTISAGQAAEYTITYEGPQTGINSLPELHLDGLDVQGPQSQSSFALQNGVTAFKLELTWQLFASKPGRHVIPAQTITLGGQDFTTKELVLDVRDGPAPVATLDPVLRISVTKTELFVGEVTSIAITALFHRRTQLRNYDHPKLPRENFVVKRFPPPGPAASVEINGERFQPIQFSSTLSAIKDGDLELGPATLECVVDLPSTGEADTRRAPPGFPPSFFQRMTTRQFSLTSETVRIKVKPLPTEGRPPDFAGAVGRFAVLSRVSQPLQQLHVGDPISVDLIVTGQGNFDSLSAPLLESADGWKLYPSKVTQENRAMGLEPGSQVYNQVIVPQKVVTQVPAFVFSFFDPDTQQYQTARSAPLAITVLPEVVKPDPRAGEAPTKDFSLMDAALPEEKLTDILTVRPARSPLLSLTPRADDDVTFWAVQAVPAAVLLAFAAVGLQRRQRERADVVRRQREGKPRELADIRRDLRRSGLSRRDFYSLAREFVGAWEFHRQRPVAASGLNGDVDIVLGRQALYSYGGGSTEAVLPIPDPEHKEVLATLDRLAR